jgi:Domain of unknown function DUF29
MVSRSKDTTGSTPASEHEKDFYSWLMQQARLVRDGRFAAVDREKLASEIEALAEEQFNKLEGALHGLLMHLLKWDHQAIRRSRGRSQSIQSQRLEVVELLARNPGLKARIADALTHSFRRARADVAQETALDEGSFPAKCPYDWDEIAAREFSV